MNQPDNTSNRGGGSQEAAGAWLYMIGDLISRNRHTAISAIKSGKSRQEVLKVKKP